jgi:hypothetical protein
MKQQINFIKYLLFHPANGFWDMKREKTGRLSVSILFIGLWIFSNVFKRQATGFLFNYVYTPLNIVSEIRNVVLISFLFCIANWAVTTLMDGESTMKDIIMTFGYATVPISIIGIPVTILTNFTTFNESAYINILINFSFIWFILLLFVGIMSINQYSAIKTIVVGAITIVTIGVIIFISILFYSIINQLIGFVVVIYKELKLRV